MDIKQLRTFIEVCELNNFTRAASSLGYAQSSVTAQIQQLEAELDVLLFERIGKSISMTPAAERMIPMARQMLMIADEMRLLSENLNEPSGILRIGAPESLCIYRLPKALKTFKERFPKMEVQLRIINGEEAVTALSNNALDVAFTIGRPIVHDQMTCSLEIPEPLAVLAAPSHLLTHKKRLTRDDLISQSLVLTGMGCHYRKAFLDRLELVEQPRIALETGSIQAIKQACISGLGICVLPSVAVMSEVESGQLKVLDYDCSDIHMVSQMIHHKDKWMSSGLIAFMEIIGELD